MPRTGLEPARLSALAPETSASTIPPPGLFLGVPRVFLWERGILLVQIYEFNLGCANFFGFFMDWWLAFSWSGGGELDFLHFFVAGVNYFCRGGVLLSKVR